MTLSVWLLTLAGLPIAVVAGRDLALNWNAADPDPWQAWAHGRARAGALAFALAAPPLSTVSVVTAAVFWVVSILFVFVLLPNRVLTEPASARKGRRHER